MFNISGIPSLVNLNLLLNCSSSYILQLKLWFLCGKVSKFSNHSSYTFAMLFFSTSVSVVQGRCVKHSNSTQTRPQVQVYFKLIESERMLITERLRVSECSQSAELHLLRVRPHLMSVIVRNLSDYVRKPSGSSDDSKRLLDNS